MATLTADQKIALGKASRADIEEYFSKLDRYLKRNIWIGKKNRYRFDTINQIKKDLVVGSTINQKHMGEYIAASTVLHCLDGWSFLGRSISAHVNGDQYSAHHLAYYAELRAAMSLLGCDGVGVFDNYHFVVESAGTCNRLPGKIGTHVFSWLALENWASLPRSSDLLMQIITPGGVSLQDWLVGFGTGSISPSIGSMWLKSWGLDLKMFTEDENRRNEVSYRPNFLNHGGNVDPIDASKFCRNIWELFEPFTYSRFELLDRHLLRISLRKSFKAYTGDEPEDNIPDFEQRIDSAIAMLAPEGLPSTEWKLFLMRSDTPLIFEQSMAFDAGSVAQHEHVIARAALLLRVATGAVAKLINNAGFNSSSLQFWWKRVGEDLGLWAPPLTVELIELWSDIENSLNEINGWENNHAGQSPSYLNWNQQMAAELDNICALEQIGLWGLGL